VHLPGVLEKRPINGRVYLEDSENSILTQLFYSQYIGQPMSPRTPS